MKPAKLETSDFSKSYKTTEKVRVMSNGNKTLAGSILFVGSVIYILGTILGEKYGSITLYNASIVLLGILMLVGAYFVQKAFKSIIFSLSLILAAVGTIGVALLTYASTEYYVLAGIGYVFFAISAIISYKYVKTPLNYVSVVLGVAALLALGLWAGNVDLGSGIMVTPITIDMIVLLWLAGFGAHIIGEKD